jgi:hypothetical protein
MGARFSSGLLKTSTISRIIPLSTFLLPWGAEMPRYYFHVKRGQVTVLDHEGVELSDISEATNEAVRQGREIGARQASHAGPPSSGVIVIDEKWRAILELPF